MKLLRISAIFQLLLSALVLTIAGKLILSLIADTYYKETNEKLIVNTNRVVQQLENKQALSSLKPILEVQEIHSPKKDVTHSAVKWIFDPLEGEEEQFMEVVSFKTINGKQYKIIVRQVFMEQHDFSDSIFDALLISFSALLLILLLSNYIISKLTWRSFYKNLDILKNLSLENEAQLQLHPSNIKEFKILNQSVTNLYERISHDYKVVKEFSEHASHEIQTPLAIIQAKQEHLLQDPSISADNRDIVLSTLESIHRLSRLNKGLLLLTKIENGQYSKNEEIVLNTFVTDVMAQFTDLTEQQKIAVSLQFSEELSVNADADLLQILLSNLISNAIKHNIEKGNITVRIQNRSLIIENSGIRHGKKPSSLFQRFEKGNDSTSSIGLGLAIVEKITKLYGWKISYTIEANQHIFTLNF